MQKQDTTCLRISLLLLIVGVFLIAFLMPIMDTPSTSNSKPPEENQRPSNCEIIKDAVPEDIMCTSLTPLRLA